MNPDQPPKVDTPPNIGTLPSGRFLAAVSGGADSVALLWLCFGSISHVLHVDHETRGDASTADAEFVVALSRRLGVACTVVRRSQLPGYAQTESSDAFRAMRLAIYRDTAIREGLDGVLLGHHADDQAETVLQRLLRGSTFEGLCGMSPDTLVGGVRLLRPLLSARAAALRQFLTDIRQPWREDASNATGKYGRNRIRIALAETPALTPAVLAMSVSARAYRDALRLACRNLGESDLVYVGEFADDPIGCSAARKWLGKWMNWEEVTPAVVARFLAWSADAASPPRLSLPGPTTAVRSRGVIRVEDGG